MDFCALECYNYSDNGVRDIPMTQEVRQNAMNLIRKPQENKLDVKSAQYLLGHSDASTTLKRYADIAPDKICGTVELLKKHCNCFLDMLSYQVTIFPNYDKSDNPTYADWEKPTAQEMR